MRAAARSANRPRWWAWLFDARDEHQRLTRARTSCSAAARTRPTAVMQETATKVNEHLDRRGRRLEDVSVGELRDIFEDVCR